MGTNEPYTQFGIFKAIDRLPIFIWLFTIIIPVYNNTEAAAQVSSVSIIKNTLFIFGFIIPVIKSSV